MHFLSFTFKIFIIFSKDFLKSPVGWDCRIHRLQLFKGERPPTQQVSCNINIYVYIYECMCVYVCVCVCVGGVEHSGEGIFGCRSHNAKLFERIETLVSGKV